VATVKYATAPKVRAAVKDMPDGHVHCRTLGHVWAHRTVDRHQKGFIQILGCKSCDTIKEQIISRQGEILSSHTTYAPGYLLKGLGRLRADTKAIVRVASLVKMLGESDA
jgi:hypothetical protein